LAKVLKAKEFQRAPLYLLFGGEQKRLLDSGARLKDRIVAELGEESYTRHPTIGDGSDEVSARDLIASLNTVSMFGGGKVILAGPVVGALGKADLQAFIAYAARPALDSTLILTVKLADTKKTTLSSFATSPLAKAFAEYGLVIKFDPWSRADALKWVEARFAFRGVEVDKDAANRLVELTSADPDRLSSEVEKLAAYVDDPGRVTIVEVEEMVGDSRESDLFAFLDAVRVRDFSASLLGLRSLLRQNIAPQIIIKMLSVELVRIAAAVDGKKRRLTFSLFHEEIGGPPYPLQKVWGGVSGWSEELAREGLWGVMEASNAMMLARQTPEAVLTALVAILAPPPSR
jgi:DNA polymerase-3 subunit delta